MGLLISVGKDTRQIVDDTKQLLTLSFKILISLVTIIQDAEDVLLEIKDLSDMLSFSVHAVDKQKVDSKLDHLKDVAGELGKRVKDKHESLNVLSLLVEDLMKMRYGKDWKEIKRNKKATAESEAKVD
jgi:hypothetical protein